MPAFAGMTAELSLWLRQRALDFGGDRGVARADLRWPSAGELAVGADQVFMEVPARRPGFAQEAGDPAIEWVGVGADHPVLLGQREIDLVIRLAELLNVGRRPRL